MSTATSSRPVINPRIAQRREQVRRERRGRRRRRTLVVLSVVALVAVAAVVERSPLVALAAVEVSGTRLLDRDTVRAAAALPVGTSTLRLRLDAAERRVEALPLVSDATVHRTDPLTVRIDVVERRPAFVLDSAGPDALVDRDGIVVAHGRRDGLPVIAVPAAQPPPLGDPVAELPAAGAAHAVHRALPGPLAVEVVRYEGPPIAAEVDLVLASGTRVRFGRADRAAEKARTVAALLAELGGRIAVIDVRAPANPVIVPAG